jgi:hypothetical protein
MPNLVKKKKDFRSSESIIIFSRPAGYQTNL